MKQILSVTILLFNTALAPAAGPAEPGKPQASASGFELRVPAPGPDAIADSILQEAIDKVAAAGGGVVLLGAGDFKLSRHADDETVILKSNVTLRGQGYATHLYLDTARGGVHLRSRAGPHRAQNRAQTLANRGASRSTKP